jgi:hypothetical protein
VLDRKGRAPAGGKARIRISRSRKLLTLRVDERALRNFSYAFLDADTTWYGRDGDAGHTDDFDEFETYFDRPLLKVSAHLHRGRVTVTSAAGARVTVVIRSSGHRRRFLRYRQRANRDLLAPQSQPHTTLRYRFSCRRSSTYTVAVHARDRYGHSRSARLRKRFGPSCSSHEARRHLDKRYPKDHPVGDAMGS